jgi:hypothetical protein
LGVLFLQDGELVRKSSWEGHGFDLQLALSERSEPKGADQDRK